MKDNTLKIKKNKINVMVVITLIIGALFAIVSISKLDKKVDSFQPVLANFPQISPHYAEYSGGALNQARQNGKTILFFAATTWCNTCSALDEELKERSSTLSEDITVLKIDYDRDRENNAKYGVTQQHTMILLDSDGNEIKRWIGGGFDELVRNLN